MPRERHPLRAGTKVAGPQGLPISMLVCVFNTGLNGKGQEPAPQSILKQGSVTVSAANAALTYAYIRIHAYI